MWNYPAAPRRLHGGMRPETGAWVERRSSIPKTGIELTTLLQPIPHTTSAAVLLQIVALGQVAEMLLLTPI
jgi:hypothetical protein